MDKQQRKALLYTVTLQQAHAISEILNNLDSLLAPKTHKPNTKRLIKRLTDPHLTLRKKVKLIQNHNIIITQLLVLTKARLLNLL